MGGCKALRIARIRLVVGDLAAACRFYETALGFRLVQPTSGRLDVSGADDLSPGRPSAAILQLGGQQIELMAFSPAGRSYPRPRAANDPWFQHFAIAVGDMDAAYAQLSGHSEEPISRGGPQRLPPSTGSVTAYKFRDPEGHPLELSFIPKSDWTQRPPRTASPFLGIDHTALVVTDLEASVEFYTQTLGLGLVGRGVNRGPEQDRLDGLPGVAVEIVSLSTLEPGPHIELLHYRSPVSAAPSFALGADDAAATRTLLQVEDLTAAAKLPRAEVRTGRDGADVVRVSDPDGHRLELLK